MKINPKSLLFIASVSTALLAGCGGGSSSGTASTPLPSPTPTPAPSPNPAPTGSTAQGLYEGTVSNGRVVSLLVLENDQVYAVYGTPVSGKTRVDGFLEGKGTANNGSFTASSIRDFQTDTNTKDIFTLSASYVSGVSFNGTTTLGTQSLTFASTAPKSSQYVYATAANPANIAGAWNLTDFFGAPVSLDVGMDGNFAGRSLGCSFAGSIKPRASGKNVFDVSLMFGGAPCRLPGQIASGIAIEYPLVGGGRQLLVAGTDAAHNNGMAYLGTR